MDFFASQDRARRSSRLLVWWFILCVIAVVLVIYTALRFVLPFWFSDTFEGAFLQGSWWHGDMAGVVFPAVGGTIILGSIWKLNELAAGGAVVARSLGGRLVPRSSAEPLERRLINVVDEMAIASGLPSPEIWLLEEESGINAFAAGTDPGNAVIGVTTGCLEKLSRDELQGVVAHEFSHILNGDMRLNQRLTGWIFGLLMISLIGRFLLECMRDSRSSRSSGKKGDPRALIAMVGGILWLVGSAGVFCSRLLQAAVSREREYLADAAAVQFTRNPAGLAGALKKIGGMDESAAIHAPAVMEVRHLFFAGTATGLADVFLRTHPPLERRIRALEPHWDGKMERTTASREKPTPRRRKPGNLVMEPVFINDPGNSSNLHVEVGDAILGSLHGKGLRLQTKEDAKYLVLALLLGQNADTRAFHRTPGLHEEDILAGARTWADRLQACPAVERMALMDLSLPFLRRMTRPEARHFIDLTVEIMRADGRISVFEFMLQKVIERQVAISVGLRRASIVRYRGIADVREQVTELLGVFASIMGGNRSWGDHVKAEFRQHLGRDLPEQQMISGFDPPSLSLVLQELDALPQLAKVQMLRLCGLVVMRDGRLGEQESELLRATAEAVGAPVPPFARIV
ncbi:M48 family metallopeptidase [Luteolibacter sp. SL250]|uniref:M48 family metallopeptidase n=1 Tax=Luteolibacter sp. SL250 TaxID=2995170 RepID=UPI00226D69BD|nr:M48 family metallopeptidase [Luteolibacter sp. SL250]WAC17796.1 M48 family metallopeptidase [Luteolibacter sp. SL250]